MYATQALFVASGLALVEAQVAGPPPPPSTLSTTMSGVLPYLPQSTGFTGVETIEGAITYDGPTVDGFTGPGGNASIQNNNPQATYVAMLPMTNFDNLTGSMIMGSIMGATPANGTGVIFTVNFTGLPSEAEYGPFVYHVHNMPVPADGNCTSTLGHLDPTNRGEYHPCEVAAPQSCQAGDLAGKHGNVTGASFQAGYLDLYLSTTPGSPYFFGDKSVVVHSTNTTRLTCANFTMVSATGTNGSSPTSGSGSTATTSSTPVATAAASKILAGGSLAMVAGVIAALML